MSSLGGFDPEDAIDPTLVELAERAIAPTPAAVLANTAGQVTSLNSLTGALAITAGANISISAGGSSVTISFTGTLAYTSITGLGAMATKNQAANPGALGTVASAAYVQGELQATIDKLNALIANLLAAGHTV